MRKNVSMYGLTLMFFLLSSALNGIVYAQTDSLCNTRSQYFYWVGGSSNDFFDELNWRVVSQVYIYNRSGDLQICRPGKQPKFILCRGNHNPDTDKTPGPGTLDPNKPLPFNLYVENAEVEINSPLIFSCIEKGLTLRNSQLKANAAIRGTVHLENSSTLRMAGPAFAIPFRVSLQDENSWVYFENIKPTEIVSLPLSVWMIGQKVPASQSSLLVNQYYQKGTVVRMDPSNYKPLSIYEGQGLSGASAEVGVETIFSGAAIPGGLDNNIRSFKLKRGFMATIAVNNNGTGKSKVYIASEEDLEITALPASLSGNVSFIRVMPWNWSTKKGTGGLFADNPLDAGWFYTWSATSNSLINSEYVPMTWGAGATLPAAMQEIIAKKKVTHLLGFNESDNCSGESGQFNNLCRPDVAVAYYERLMGSGLRLGTPAPRENGPTTWLREFAAIAKQRDVRFDFVAVHWYDWGSNPANSPNANPQDVFNRFKAYLTQVYNEYQLPIWVTEFNANPNRNNSVHAAFLELALPYLESLPYIERYAYFQPDPKNATNGVNPNANYFDNANNLTNIGHIYLGHPSTPSMPDDTYECPNNLEGLDQPLVVKQPQQFVFEAECGKNPGSKWRIVNNDLASNGKFIRGDNAPAGTTELAKLIHYDFDVVEENNFRIWVRTRSSNGTAIIHINHERKDTIRGINSTDFTWHSIPVLYTFKPGTNRVSLSYLEPNNVITQFDQIAIVAGSDDVTAPLQPAESCSPEPLIWGIETPVAIFAEGEAASKGAGWTTDSNEEAIGGLFVQSGAATSPDGAPAESGWLTFTVDVTTAGAYQFWAKLQSLEATSNKLWVKVNDDEFKPWNDLQQPGYQWKWKRYDPATSDASRQEYLFLEPGTQTITIAYASGGVKIDRVALMPAGNSPAAIDPDVIAPAGPQSFEAEEALFIGTPTIAATCNTASNNLIVNMGNSGSNGLQFGGILAAASGPHQLSIAYFVGGASPRSMRVFVNGVLQPIQSVAVSGPWCFEGGSPSTWLMSVNLNAGNNTVELRPVQGANAPLIDKIEVRPIITSFEAELAQFSGNVTTPACTSASNGTLANMGNTTTNSITFNNISVSAAGTYQINISHFSKLARTMRMSVNGNAATTISFSATGNWCFENPAGVAVVKSVPVTLQAGVNTIRFQPPLPSGEAPVLDKIDLVDPSNPEDLLTVNSKPANEEGKALLMNMYVPNETGFVYPNPARPGSTIYLTGDKNLSTKAATITLLDIRGAAIKTAVQPLSAGFNLPNVPRGIYMVRVNDAGQIKTYRVLVQ